LHANRRVMVDDEYQNHSRLSFALSLQAKLFTPFSLQNNPSLQQLTSLRRFTICYRFY
jgi:hypothetical protein